MKLTFGNLMRSGPARAMLVLTFVSGSLFVSQQSLGQEDSSELFKTDVLPVLKAKCGKCHNADSQKGELNLIDANAILDGGESGAVISTDDPEASLLWEYIDSGEMPPEKSPQLTPAEKERIHHWIKSGAKTGAESNRQQQLTQLDILPILQLRCTVCHGTRAKEGELDLRSVESILVGGKSGPAIIAGNTDESLILKRVHAGEMPPKQQLVRVSVKPVSDSEIKLIEDWIAAGAKTVGIEEDIANGKPDPLISNEDRKFWSFVPPVKANIPSIEDRVKAQNAVDYFVMAKLDELGLELSPEASRRTLIRRLFLDLLGLPPTPAEIAAFESDTRPDAYERLVEKLLASPEYGARWGGYWLDLAGYADSEGLQESDRFRPSAYRYRDYVISSFNRDKSYARFVMEQLAGDELADYTDPENVSQQVYENVIATGFMRMTIDGTFAGITGFVPDRLVVIGDLLQVYTSSMLGLTMKCAKCHTHKFDPIPQRDYYRLAAIFKGALDENDWLIPIREGAEPGQRDRFMTLAPAEERRAWQSEHDRIDNEISKLEGELESLRQTTIERLEKERLEKLPEVIRGDVAVALETVDEERSEIQKFLAEKFAETINVDPARLAEVDDGFKKVQESTTSQIKSLNGSRPEELLVRALWDRGEPSPTYILKRGNYLTPGRPVGPGVPSVLVPDNRPLQVQPGFEGSPGTGRRLALANWMVQEDHPLTARVMVNRIWRYHFGQGIVRTLDDFGIAGARPTHQELLDWLAVEFMEHGWSIKHMHRLMLLSATFRQQSLVNDEHLDKDPENLYLARMSIRRLDAESLRDSLLAVSGLLKHEPFGKPDSVTRRADGLVTSNEQNGGWRRSIFVMKRRSEIPTILANFDRPRMSPNCIDRVTSTVAPQALQLLNNAQVKSWAESFAARVISEGGSTDTERISYACVLATSYKPVAMELEIAQQTIEKLRVAWKTAAPDMSDEELTAKIYTNLCHALFNSASFVYVD
ncbi:MAG: DUF1553 domain-containing protein [Pirellulaceae bacterium]